MIKDRLTDPDQVTAHLRLLEIYQRQRAEAGRGNTSLRDLNEEAEILIRILDVQNRMMLYDLGERVWKSIEGELYKGNTPQS